MPKYDNNFLSCEDLIDNIDRGCEVQFLYNGKKYWITPVKQGIYVYEINNEDSERLYLHSAQAMEYAIGNKKIKDILADMKIISRSF